jgi:poly(beta-D-mannuronate) C5 epimerase
VRNRRDGLGVYALVLAAVVGTAVIATVVAGKDRRAVYSTAEHFHRHIASDAFDPISSAERGLLPTATAAHLGKPHREIRAILIEPGSIRLLVAGKPVARIAVTGSPVTLQDVVRAVHDSRWLSESRGVVTLRSALIADRGSKVLVSAPSTRELAFARKPNVFLGARHATLTLDGVVVRAQRGNGRATRGFVVAQRHSTLVIRRSAFRSLGHDWNSSYGVTWASGSGGSVVGSSFSRCYIAIYTDAAHDLLIRGNVLRRNTLYGIDPHSRSTHITVVGNLSEGNGRHGIIFSQDVTASIVRGNVARANHLNGIMMDAHSTGNVVAGNLVEANHGDGIVLAHSGANTVVRNRIHDNRVGILVRGSRRHGLIRGNEISGNVLAVQGTTSAGNTVRDNGGEWEPHRLAVIWIATVPATAALWLLTLMSRGTRERRRRRLRVATSP